jgi:uncharacterized protein (DUF1501 family)
MPVTRRKFIKLGAGAVSVGIVLPHLFLRNSLAQSAHQKKFVVIQLSGGNDGLNTVIPYADANYHAIRPSIGFNENELRTAQGNSTVISNQLGLHPSMGAIKSLYDEGKLAVIVGAGYPDSTLSHFLAMDVWQTGDPSGLARSGWLGKYADSVLIGQEGLPAASFGGELPKAFHSSRFVIPNISDFSLYNFLGDPNYPGDYNNQYSTFVRAASRQFPEGSFISDVNNTMLASVQGAERVQTAVNSYEPLVEYPEDNPLAFGLRMAAQVMTTLPEALMMHVEMGGFDTHADQIAREGNNTDKRSGWHATLLGWYSDAVAAFLADMQAHNINDVVILQWSEFGRRPEENASAGTDHSTSGPMFIIGNPVKGGIYGQQPSLAPLDLDDGGNPKFHVDFREVYATVLDRWFGFDSRNIFGASYPNVGFL